MALKEPVTKEPFDLEVDGKVYTVKWCEGDREHRWPKSYFIEDDFGIAGIVSFRPMIGRRYWPEGAGEKVERACIDKLNEMERAATNREGA